jgi:AraC-like DNA-binding protein
MLLAATTPDALAAINSALSYGCMTLFLVSTMLAIRDLRGFVQGQLLIALLVSASGLALTIMPDAGLLPPSVVALALAIGLPNLGLLWWFCLSVLRDDFRIGPLEWAGLIALMVVPLVYFLAQLGVRLPFLGIVNAFGSIPPLIMVGHVIWLAVSGRATDLVEERRFVRLCLVFAPLASLVVALIAETLPSVQLGTMLRIGLGILPVQLLLFFWLVRMPPGALLFQQAREPVAEPVKIDPKNVDLHRRLMAAMETDQVYLRHSLTIDSLAETLKVPAHQLRRLINASLGFRNFANFLNGYRLNYAKAALANPARSRDAILAIAFDAGFASLPSFNRVFKEVEGQTPTEFRSKALSQPSQN